MGLPFKQMYTQVAQFVQDSSAGREIRIKDAINRHYTKVTQGEDWPDLWRIETAEVQIYAGVPYVFLPAHVDLVKKAVLDSNKDLLSSQDPSMFISRFFDTMDTSANPYSLVALGSSPTKRRIAAAETMTFVSSDAGDVGLDVELWGLVSGEEIGETIALNGTSTVASVNSYERITRIGTATSRADSSRAGNITVTGTTSSLEYAVIKNHEFDSRYQQMRVQDAPASNDTLTIFYKKKVQRLIEDGDSLELDCDLVLIEFAIADILQQQGKYNQGNIHLAIGEDMRLKLLSRFMMQTDVVMQSVPSGPGNGSNTNRVSVVSG